MQSMEKQFFDLFKFADLDGELMNAQFGDELVRAKEDQCGPCLKKAVLCHVLGIADGTTVTVSGRIGTIHGGSHVLSPALFASNVLIRHEAFFALGKLGRSGGKCSCGNTRQDVACVELMTKVACDPKENFVVRHEAADGLGAWRDTIHALGYASQTVASLSAAAASLVPVDCDIKALRHSILNAVSKINGSQASDWAPRSYQELVDEIKKDTTAPWDWLDCARHVMLFKGKTHSDYAQISTLFMTLVNDHTESNKSDIALFKHEVVFTLGRCFLGSGNKEVAESLANALTDRSEPVITRHEAAVALASVAGAAAVSVLQSCQNEVEGLMQDTIKVSLALCGVY